jgi:hypothetical protein
MMHKIIAILVGLFVTVHVAFGGTALVSQFNEWGATASGSLLHKYPAKLCLERSSCLRVYPAAVHTNMVRKFRYKVLLLKNPKTSKSLFVHITDECDKNTSSCARNHKKAKRMGGLLIDLHQTGMKPLGIRSWSLYKMKYRTVGRIPPNKMERVLSYDGKKRYVPSAWKL